MFDLILIWFDLKWQKGTCRVSRHLDCARRSSIINIRSHSGATHASLSEPYPVRRQNCLDYSNQQGYSHVWPRPWGPPASTWVTCSASLTLGHCWPVTHHLLSTELELVESVAQFACNTHPPSRLDWHYSMSSCPSGPQPPYVKQNGMNWHDHAQPGM